MSVAFILSVFIRRKTQVEVHWKLANVDWRTTRKILTVGLPQSAGMILMALSFFFFNRVVVSVDPLALTAFALCGRLDQAVLMPIFAIGAALITMIGQNAGRGNFRRVREIWRKSLLTAMGLVVLSAAGMFLLAVVFVFLVLAAQYEGWTSPAAVIAVVPLAALGVVIALLMRGMDNNTYTQVGVVLLVGLASKNAILIVEFAREQRREGFTIQESAVNSANLRFRAILMTAF